MIFILMQYVFKAAIRDRLVLSILILLGLSISLSIFLGSAAVIEKSQFVAVYAAGGIRLLNFMGIVLFTVFFIRRSFEAREIEFMLSRPVSRTFFLLGYWGACVLIAVLIGLVSGVALSLLNPNLFSQGYVLWTLSLMLENAIVASAALFFAMVLSSAVTGIFAVTGFYVLTRMMTQILGIIDSKLAAGTALADVLENIMQIISMCLPRLDLFAQTSWLLYGPDESIGIGFLLAQGVISSLILFCAALIDFKHKQF